MTTTAAQQAGEQPSKPRFSFRPHRNDVIDHQTGRWMSLALAQEFAAVVNAAAPPSPESSSQGSLDDSAPTRKPLTPQLEAAVRETIHWLNTYFSNHDGNAYADKLSIILDGIGSDA